jgi:hypothetical protein
MHFLVYSDQDGHDEDFIREHMPDVDAGYAEDPQGYDGDRDAMGFQGEEVENDDKVIEKSFEAHFAKVDTNGDSFLDYKEVCDFLVCQLVFTHVYFCGLQLDARLRATMIWRLENKKPIAMMESQKQFKIEDKNADGEQEMALGCGGCTDDLWSVAYISRQDNQGGVHGAMEGRTAGRGIRRDRRRQEIRGTCEGKLGVGTKEVRLC